MKRLLLAPLLALLMSGCAGYHIGAIKPTFMQGVETIAVPTFRNDTLEPRVEVMVADAVIKQIQQDGTYRIVSEDKADAILEGRVEKIKRNSVRSVRGNVLATKEFELTMTIHYRLYRRGTGEKLDETGVTGTTNFFVSDDLQQDEVQSMPIAAERAAVRLVSRISEGW